MYKQEQFEKSVNILVNAYHNEVLVHANCAACAVGNLIHDCATGKSEATLDMRTDWFSENFGVSSAWGQHFCTVWLDDEDELEQYFYENPDDKLLDKKDFLDGRIAIQVKTTQGLGSQGRRALEMTNYPLKVLQDIEWAFESVPINTDDRELAGLYAVYEVLCKYHRVEIPVDAYAVFVDREPVV